MDEPASDKGSALLVPATLRGDALWGAKAIATFMDCSTDKVQTLRDSGAPISKIGGQLFALRSELMKWLQRQAA